MAAQSLIVAAKTLGVAARTFGDGAQTSDSLAEIFRCVFQNIFVKAETLSVAAEFTFVSAETLHTRLQPSSTDFIPNFCLLAILSKTGAALTLSPRQILWNRRTTRAWRRPQQTRQ